MSDDLQPLSPAEGVDRFITHREPSVRKSTLQNAKTRLGHFLDWCDERDVDELNDLTGRDLADFVAWRRGEIKALTLQKQLSTIRQALRWWADIEAVPEGLAEKIHAPELPDGAESKDVALDPERARELLDYYDQYHRGSRDHVILSLLWRTGMRRSALRSLDVDDLEPDEHAVRIEHRPKQGTKLKNGTDGDRWVYLGPVWYSVVDDYLSNPDRFDVEDDYGREPLITTMHGRPSKSSFSKWVYKMTQPCELGECPHGVDPEDCDARVPSSASKCPSSVGPHAVRRGAITHHLTDGIPPEVASERMNVSLNVLYEHYDVRTEREKMAVRKEALS
ncbi:tyrosine-type recombinase/integrase [Salinigranum sp. GCM10025319]|uniref:tyrosine-type recombinase/integrase n=1 Tax=Salinigranum sp. GCM10025319 TaxID=3252687 RepID=UPI0036202817